MVDSEGFEPSVGCPTAAFQATGLNQLSQLSAIEE